MLCTFQADSDEMSDFGCLLQISRQSVASKQHLTEAAMKSLAHQVVQHRQVQQSLQQQLQEHQQLHHQQASLQAEGKQPEQPKADRAKPPWYKRHKSVAAVVWGAASLLQHNNVTLRSLKVASLLYIVHDHDR